MANTTVKGKFNVVAENGDVQTIYPKTTGDQVLVDRSSNASVIPNDVANLQHIVNKMGSLALKSKVETSDFTTGTMINSLEDLKSNTDTGKIADATVVKDIESRVDTLENSNLVTVDELDAGLATKPDTEINDSVTSTSLTWSSKKLSDQLTTLNSNTSLLTNRVNTLIELPDGATTNDARLEDIRNGYNNTVYNSPGESVRTQISDLHDKIDEVAYVFKIPYDNMNTTTNYFFGADGAIYHHNNSGLVITDYIQIPYYIKKILVNKYFSSTTYNDNYSSIVFYNKHMIPISITPYRTICENNEITVGMNKFILDVPEDSAYIRLTLENTSNNIITQSYIMFYNIPDIENPSYYYDLIKNTIIHEVSDISWEENKYLNSNGDIVNYNDESDSTYYISDFIPVGDYNNIFIYNHKHTRYSNHAYVCFYSNLKSVVKSISINKIKINDIIDIPQNAVYVRFSISGEHQLDTIEEKIYLLNSKKIENDASLYDSELIEYTYINKNGTMVTHPSRSFNAGFIFVGDASSLILTAYVSDASGYSFFDYDGNLIYSVTNDSRISKYNYNKTVDIGVPENAATMRFTANGGLNTYFKKYKDYKKLKKHNIDYRILHDGYINESDEEVESDLYMYSDKLLLLQNEYFILNNYTKSNTDNPCYAIIYSASNTINRIIPYNNNYGPLIYKAGINDYYIRFCIDSDCDNKFEIFFTSFINNSDIEIPFYNEPDIHDSIGLIQCFDKVGCIGDSLASGEVGYLDSNGERHFSDKYEHSWGQYLARMTGNTYYNWSSGGRTTKSWLASPYATQCYDGNHLCSAYIIGLAANDIDPSKLPGGVGEESDIDLEDYTNNNPDTFYGCYGTIIQKILEIQPLAKIFIFTLPLSNEQANIFNTAIRNIASKFLNVYLIDLASPENIQFYRSTLIRKCIKFGHYNAIGYRQMALFIANQINKVMKDNIDDFMDIDWIPIS